MSISSTHRLAGHYPWRTEWVQQGAWMAGRMANLSSPGWCDVSAAHLRATSLSLAWCRSCASSFCVTASARRPWSNSCSAQGNSYCILTKHI